MNVLTKDQIFNMHSELIESYGGADGVRDDGLLESALAAPFQSFGGQYVYSTIQQKAARIGFGLIKNHPFIDGNKRVGAHVMLMTLLINGIDLVYTQKDLYEIILKVAASEASFDDLLNWVLSHKI